MTIGSGQLSQRRAVLRYLGDRAATRLGMRSRARTGRPEVEAADLFADREGLDALLTIGRGDRVTERDFLPGWIPGIWEAPLIPDLLRAAGYPFPFRGVLNLGVQRSVLRLPLVGDRHRLKLALVASEPIRAGEKLAIDSTLLDARGEERVQSRLSILLRRPSGKGRSRDSADPGSAPPRWIADWELTPRDAQRYAEVSGDRNPIHLGGIVGRLLGYPRPILHGACLEAMAWSALAPGIGEGDFSIRFERPLVLPASVAVRARERSGADPVAFSVVPSGGGRPFATGYHVDPVSREAQG